MFIKFLFPLFSPESSGGGTSGGGEDDDSQSELSQDLKDLGDVGDVGDKGEEGDDGGEEEEDEGGNDSGDEGGDDSGEEGNESEEEGEESEEEEEEGEEEEDDDKGKKKGELERDVNGRATVKSINAKYPGMFKELPELKRAFFLLPKFEEVFADPAQAQEAADKSKEFDELEESIVVGGSPKLLIKTLSETNPKALKKMLGNFAESVRNEYEDGYLDLARPILEELVFTAFQRGSKTGDKNLALSARHIANFIFGNGGEIPDITKRAKNEPSEAEKELEKERSARAFEKLQNAVRDIMPQTESALAGILNNNLKGLTPFERKAVVREARAEVDGKLRADTTFQNSIQKLWDRAKLENYSNASKERVKNAWLSRAKQLAVQIRDRLRKEALGARKGGGAQDEKEKKGKRTFIGSGGQGRGRSSSRVLDPHKIDWKKTSDMDILDS